MHTICAVALLFVGRWWRYAGWFFSVTSLIAIFVQYLCQFNFVTKHWIGKADLKWWGLKWSFSSVVLHMLIILLSLIQRVLTAKYHKISQERKKRLHIGLAKYAPTIAIAGLVFSAVVRPTGYSIVYILTAWVVSIWPACNLCRCCKRKYDDADSLSAQQCFGLLCSGNLVRIRLCSFVLLCGLIIQSIAYLGPPPFCDSCKPFAEIFESPCRQKLDLSLKSRINQPVQERDIITFGRKNIKFSLLFLNFSFFQVQLARTPQDQLFCVSEFQRWLSVPSDEDRNTVVHGSEIIDPEFESWKGGTLNRAALIWDFFFYFIICIVVRIASKTRNRERAHMEAVGKIGFDVRGIRRMFRGVLAPFTPWLVISCTAIAAVSTKPLFSAIYAGFVIAFCCVSRADVTRWRAMVLTVMVIAYFQLFILLVYQVPIARCSLLHANNPDLFMVSSYCKAITDYFMQNRYSLSSSDLNGNTDVQITWVGVVIQSFGLHKVDLDDDGTFSKSANSSNFQRCNFFF